MNGELCVIFFLSHVSLYNGNKGHTKPKTLNPKCNACLPFLKTESCRTWKTEQQNYQSSLEGKKKNVFFAKILYDLVATINAHLVEMCLHIQKHKKKTFEGWQCHHFILTWTKNQRNISSQMPFNFATVVKHTTQQLL